jgi:hypothetical protein
MRFRTGFCEASPCEPDLALRRWRSCWLALRPHRPAADKHATDGHATTGHPTDGHSADGPPQTATPPTTAQQTAPPVTELPPVTVIGTTPLFGSGVDRDTVPAETNVLKGDDLTRGGTILPDPVRVLHEQVGGVDPESASGNPYQPTLV